MVQQVTLRGSSKNLLHSAHSSAICVAVCDAYKEYIYRLVKRLLVFCFSLKENQTKKLCKNPAGALRAGLVWWRHG